jgi:hypothetical protein
LDPMVRPLHIRLVELPKPLSKNAMYLTIREIYQTIHTIGPMQHYP